MSLRAGLCSVTLRGHDPDEIVDLAVAAGLECIEWGGDVHVPHGDLATATRVGARTSEAGLTVASYGSYLFCDDHGVHGAARVCDTAAALGTRLVRVWCPWGITADATEPERAAVARSVGEVVSVAADAGLELYLEFHAETLTATASSTLDLLDRVGAPNLRCAWQPPYWAPQTSAEESTALHELSDRLAHVHVYAWSPDGTRHPLATDEERWLDRLAVVAAAPEMAPAPRAALVEFVRDDDPAQLLDDAATLRRWLSGPA